MQILTKDEFMRDKEHMLERIRAGAIYIHPTDTIYGIGCNAQDSDAVTRVRVIKRRNFLPFSVIAPSVEWIRQNCLITEAAEEWLAKLPGPYTLILRLTNKNAITPEVNNNLNTLGVRMPDHWFAEVTQKLGIPLITTSVNIKGEEFMTSLEDLDTRVSEKIDFIIYEGPKESRPSTIVDFTKKEPQVLKR